MAPEAASGSMGFENSMQAACLPRAQTVNSTMPPVVEPTLYHFSFIGAGDNMAYYGNVRDAKKNAEGTDLVYDFRPSYTDIKPVIADYDLRFINQETLMCGDGYDLSYYPRFNSPQELGDAVVDTGFNLVGLANNHMLDRGESGLLATLDYWDSQPVTHIGSCRSSKRSAGSTFARRTLKRSRSSNKTVSAWRCSPSPTAPTD